MYSKDFAWNYGNHQNFDPSFLFYKLWMIFMGMKQKKIQNGRLKKTEIFNSPNSQSFFMKISLIGPWFSRINPIRCVISRHSVGDAPTNSKSLDFSQFDPYFHLVKSFFIFYFCNFYKKINVEIFFRPKKERFFHKNGQKHIFLTNIGCFKYVISMLWEILWGALHVCRSKIGYVENLFHILLIFESPQPRSCSWRGYAT